MSDHAVAYDDLLAYAWGELAGDRADAIARHVAACAECAATVRRVGLVQSTVRADATLAPSPDALTRVLALISGRQPVSEPGPGLAETFRRAVAALTFDSRADYARAGLRGAADAYLLGFEIAGIHIDLQVEPPAGPVGACQLTGQIDRPAGGAVQVLARAEGGPLAGETESDEHGVFLLNLPPGVYDLELSVEGETIVLAGLAIP